MTTIDPDAGLFPALLKHWRGRRGLSQLDLALASDVSNKHISFLETGRSTPSAQMVVRLATALDVPLRHVNAMLEAAGFEGIYPEASGLQALTDEVTEALRMMKEHHEPFPLVVIDRAYNVLDLNRGAATLFSAAVGSSSVASGDPMNLIRLTFDPNGAQSTIRNFEEVGRTLLWRLQREVLANPNDSALRSLLEETLAMPTVDDDWRETDLTEVSSPALLIHLQVGDVQLRFVTMLTVFQAPQAVALDELRIESWFPSDPATHAACQALARG